MADVDLTVEAIDRTGDTLSNIERELLNVNEVVQRQADSFERVEKQFMEFQESITKNLPFFLTAFGELGTNIKGVTTALKDAQKAQKGFNTESKKSGADRDFGDGEGKVSAPDEKAYTEYLKSQMKSVGDAAVDLQQETHRRMLSNEKNHSDAMQSVIKEDTKEYIAEIERKYDGGNAVMSNSHNEEMRSLQQSEDKKFQRRQKSHDKALAERQRSRESLGDVDKQHNKIELSEYDKQTKILVDKAKTAGDLEIKVATDASDQHSQIIKNSLKDEINLRDNSHDKISSDIEAFSNEEVEKTNAKYHEMISADKSFRDNKTRSLKLQHELELAEVDQADEKLVEKTKQAHVQETAAQDKNLTERTKSIASAKERDLALIKQSLNEILTVEKTARDKEIADMKVSHSEQERNEKEHIDKMVLLAKSEQRRKIGLVTHKRAMGREDIIGRQSRDELGKREAAESEKREEKERQENLKRIMDQGKADEREYADTMKQVKESVLSYRKLVADEEKQEEQEKQQNLKRIMAKSKMEEREYADTMKQVKETVLATRKEAAEKEAAAEKEKQQNLKRIMAKSKAEEREYADTVKQAKEAVLSYRKLVADEEKAEEQEKQQNLKRIMDKSKMEEREYADTMKQVKEAVLATRKEAAEKEAAEEKEKQQNLKRIISKAAQDEKEHARVIGQIKEKILAHREEMVRKNRILLERFEEDGKRLISKIGKTGLGRTLGVINRTITGAMTADFAMIGLREVFDFANAVKDAVVQMEGMKLSLTAVEGSAQKAYDQLERIEDIAKLPGVFLESAIKATTTLRALKLEAELTERTIVTIGNALATLGRETELGGVVLALSQIIGKGKVHAEEINQIAERLPLIRGVLVEQFGTANTEILQRMEISIEDFVAKITEGLERLPQVATTIGTELKNMENQWFLFKANLGTLLKPGIMTAIAGVTKLLDAGNALLDKLNEAKKEEIIATDKEKRIEEHIKRVQISKGEHQPTSTRLDQLHKNLENAGEGLRVAADAMKNVESSDLGPWSEVTLKLATRNYKENFDSMNKATEAIQVLNKRVDSSARELEKMDSTKLQETIDLLEARQSSLLEPGNIFSEFELGRIEPVIATTYKLLYEALERESQKVKPDTDLEEAMRRLIEDKVKEYIGAAGRGRVTHQEEQRLQRDVKSGYSPEFDEFEGGADLQLQKFLRERSNIAGDDIAQLAEDVQADRMKIAKIFFPKEHDDMYKKSKQKAGTEQGKKDVEKARKDLIELEEKAIGMMVDAGTKLIQTKEKLDQEVIRKALEFEREYSNILLSREQMFVDRFAKQFYQPDTETGDPFGLAKTDIELPRNTEEIKKWISQQMPEVLQGMPADFQDRFADEMIKVTNDLSKSIKAAATGESAINRATGPLQREDRARRQVEIGNIIQSLIPEEGIEQTPQQIQTSISALEDAKLLEKFQAYPELQKQFDNEIKTLNKQKISTEKEIIKSQQSFLRIYLDTLKKAADVAYRETSEIERSLAEVRSIIDSYDADYGKDISSQQMIDDKKAARRTEDQLVKELGRTRKHEYTQQINEIKNLVDQQQIGQTLSLEDIDKYKSQLKEIDAAAKQHGITIESITTELESLGKQENSIRRQMITEMLKTLNSFEMMSAPVQSTLDVLSSVDLSKLTPEELESTVSQVQELVKKDKENTQNMVRVLGESWSQPPVGWENEGLRGATSPFIDTTGEASRAMIDQMNAFNTANIPTEIPKGIPREEFFALPDQTQQDLFKFNQARVSADQQIQDYALSTASNIISAWANVSSSTDTMIDDVVGATAQIAVNMTQMILNIQTASNTAASTTGITGALGTFAKYAGFAGLGLTAATTIYSFIDQNNESKTRRNSVKSGRPRSVPRR